MFSKLSKVQMVCHISYSNANGEKCKTHFTEHRHYPNTLKNLITYYNPVPTTLTGTGLAIHKFCSKKVNIQYVYVNMTGDIEHES